MPLHEELIRRIEPEAWKTMADWYGQALPADFEYQVKSWTAIAIGELLRGCECARDSMPPKRRQQDFWYAAERCEREHHITFRDLVRSGILHTPADLRPSRGKPRHELNIDTASPTLSFPAGVPRLFNRGGNPLDSLTAATRDCLSRRRSRLAVHQYTTDDRFWHYLNAKRQWVELRDDDVQALLRQAPAALHGRFLGYLVRAMLKPDGKVTYAGVEYPSAQDAAQAAREDIAAEFPYDPGPYWQHEALNGSVELLRYRVGFWKQLERAFDAGDAAADLFWDQNTAHEAQPRGERPYRLSLQRFLYEAIVGGLPRRRPRDFGRGILRRAVREGGPNLLCGEILVCKYGHESDGYCQMCLKAEFRPIPPTRTRAHTFELGTRMEHPAWRCQTCGNVWLVRRNDDVAETCPLDGGPHGERPTVVWVEAPQVYYVAPEILQMLGAAGDPADESLE